MSTFLPGDAVRVYLGGKNGDGSVCQGECTAVDAVGPTPIHVNFALWSGEFPESWVEPVTPPCPWTDDGTVIAYGRPNAVYDVAILIDGKWHQMPRGPIRDARDQTTCVYSWEHISNLDPYRLVPEVSS